MKYVVVVPWVLEDWKNECLETCKFENILEVDNRVGNRGVAASWNLGIDFMNRQEADWLILLSTSMRFGRAGGLDFIKALEDYPEAIAIEAAPHFSWHLIAFNKQTIKKAGRFDENFYPAYYEDFDYANRVYLTNEINPPYWRKVNIDATHRGFGESVRRVGIAVDNDKLQKYYKQKWGRLRGLPRYEFPFDDPGNSIKYWPESDRGGKWDD